MLRYIQFEKPTLVVRGYMIPGVLGVRLKLSGSGLFLQIRLHCFLFSPGWETSGNFDGWKRRGAGQPSFQT